jgi:hypothetical protein
MGDLVDHAAECAQCSEALRIAREVRAEAPGHAPAPVRQLPRRQLPVVAGLGLAAAAAALLLLRSPAPEPEAVERGTNGGSSAEALRALSSDHQRPDSVVLRWVPYPGARYNVTVLAPDLTVVHRAVGLAEPQLLLPPTAVHLGASGQLLWNVDAVLPDGRTLASSTFRLYLQ